MVYVNHNSNFKNFVKTKVSDRPPSSGHENHAFVLRPRDFFWARKNRTKDEKNRTNDELTSGSISFLSFYSASASLVVDLRPVN